MYLHEQHDWPNFFWDQDRLTDLLIQLRHQQGRLIGGMESMGFKLREEAVLETLTKDVVKSSEIEGEILDQESVRSSVAKRLGIDSAALNKVDRNVDGVVEMMLDATQNFDQSITRDRLLTWHTKLFPTGLSGYPKISIGAWRTGHVEVISGPIGRETVHFEGPSAARLDKEMNNFMNWANNESGLDFVLKAAIAHFWFVTLHPFDDGNGRIARAIGDLFLARSEKSSHRFYSLSALIQKERKAYYAILEKTQNGKLDITPWLEWIFGCLGRAIDEALKILDKVIYKTHFWELIAQTTLNDRQRKVINLMLDGFEGKLTSSKWAKITNCSQDTAYRDILTLINEGILIKNPQSGRSTSYSLKLDQPSIT